jgi:RNA polymerase sigma-70 factor (ECF subfamily)
MEPTQTGENMAALSDSLSIAFLVVLESLAPMERAAFILREVFDYDYSEIAEIVETSPDNCRQMVSRARKRLHNGRPRFQADPTEQQEIMTQFVQACLDGDMSGLLALLAEDVVKYSDGGGKVSSAIFPLHGPDKVARLFIGITKKAPPSMEMRFGLANNHPALFAYVDGRVVTVVLLDIVNGRIQHIYAINNPDKLQHIKRLEMGD